MARIHPGQSYLLSYNNLQLLGWSYILYCYISESCASGNWLVCSAHVEFLLRVFQTLGLIEILHASVRLVNSSPFTVGIQLFSRVFVIWGILFLVPNSKHQTIAVPLTILSWCCAEIIRYLFYALNICNLVFYPVKLLRYSGFMLLYPTGISGELMLMYRALAWLWDRNLYEMSMPNAANISFGYKWLIMFIMLSYVPLSPKIYRHMLAQRKKALHRKSQ